MRRWPLRRRFELVATVLLLSAAIVGWADSTPSSAEPEAPTTGAAPGRSPETAGRRLYVQGCSDCHGYDAKGIPGKAPSLIGVGELAADFYLRTGRMPLARPGDEPVRSESPYTADQIQALESYIGSFGGPPIPPVHVSKGDAPEGQKLFTDHCAGCHQVVGQGGIMPGAVVPDLGAASPTDVAEAVRIGPYVMPKFDHLDQSEIDDIAAYVQSTHDPEDKGGWGIGHIGPIPEGMVAWLLAGAALILTIRLIGEREKS